MSALIFVTRVNNASLVYMHMLTFILCQSVSTMHHVQPALARCNTRAARAGLAMITAPCTSGYQFFRVMAFVFVVNTDTVVEAELRETG